MSQSSSLSHQPSLKQLRMQACDRRAATSRFFRAAEQGDLPAIRALVAARPDLVRLDQAENDEHTALHYAVLNRDLACTRFLLEAGADSHKGIYPHRDATSPLTPAEDRGYDDLVALIRGELDRRAAQAGADPERGDELFDLVRAGDLDGVKRLLEASPERIAEVDARPPTHSRRCWSCCSPRAWTPTSASICTTSTSRCRAGACRCGTQPPTASTRWRRRCSTPGWT